MSQINDPEFNALKKKYNQAVMLKNPQAIYAAQKALNALQNRSQSKKYFWTNWMYKPSGGKTCRRGRRSRSRSRSRRTRRR
jgi:hypothetical protein